MGIDVRWFRRKKRIHARALKLFPVALERTRIFCKILVGAELLRIDKDGSNHRRALPSGLFDQRQMPRVQSTHRRHQPDDAVFRTRLPGVFLHPCNCSDGFHGLLAPASCRLSLSRSWKGAHRLRARRGGTFAIEMHQICRDGLCAKLPQQSGDLSAVIGPVIHQMLH